MTCASSNYEVLLIPGSKLRSWWLRAIRICFHFQENIDEECTLLLLRESVCSGTDVAERMRSVQECELSQSDTRGGRADPGGRRVAADSPRRGASDRWACAAGRVRQLRRDLARGVGSGAGGGDRSEDSSGRGQALRCAERAGRDGADLRYGKS